MAQSVEVAKEIGGDRWGQVPFFGSASPHKRIGVKLRTASI